MKIQNELFGKKTDILEELSSIQIDDVIAEVELEREGFKFIYSIDPYDIENYCFPLGVLPNEERLRKVDFNYLTQENTALYYLFELHPYPVIILDEYLDELIGFKQFVVENVKEGKHIIDALAKLNDGTSFKLEELQEANEVITNNFSLFVALAADTLHPGIEKFNHLLKEDKFIIDHDQLKIVIEGQKTLKNFEKVFEEVKPGTLALELFEYVYKNKLFLHKENEIDQQRALINKYNDCKIFDRIISINQNLKNIRNNKSILIYLSSGSSFSRIIRGGMFREYFPMYKRKPFSIHRNAAQIYLKLLTESENTDITIKALKTIKEVVKLMEELGDSQSTHSKDYSKEIHQIITNIKERRFRISNELLSNNISLIKKSHQIQMLFEKAGRKKSGFQDLLSLLTKKSIDKVFALPNAELLERRQILLSRLKGEQRYIKILIDGFEKISSNQETFRIAKGQDLVSGSAQHLPLIFFLNQNSPLQKIIDELSIHIIEYDRHCRRTINSNDVYQQIDLDLVDRLKKNIEQNVLQVFSSKRYSNIATPDEIIIRYLVCLILPINEDNNLFVRGLIEEFTELDKIVTKKLNETEFLNFEYIRLWISRRLSPSGTAEMIKEVQKTKSEFSDDPRFYHALGLAYYCYALNDELPHLKKLENLKKADKQLQTAYEIFGKTTFSSSQLKTYLLNDILNSRCYINTLLCEENNFQGLLETALQLNNDLKKNDKDYENVAEYLHTEAVLLFVQYKNCNDNEKEMKLQLLNKSLEKISTAIRLKPKSLYEQFEWEVQNVKKSID